MLNVHIYRVLYNYLLTGHVSWRYTAIELLTDCQYVINVYCNIIMLCLHHLLTYLSTRVADV